MKRLRVWVRHALALGMLSLPSLLINAQNSALAANGIVSAGDDSQIESDLTRTFSKDRFQHIHSAVDRGIVTLTGTVGVYAVREEADRKARHTKNVIAVRNLIEAGGTRVPDQELQQKLVNKLEYDRVGYGTTAFNAIGVAVRDGVVTLGGHSYGPADKESAISAASNTPGVRDLIDDIEVDPVSLMDDQLRIATARAVYGFSSLNKYAFDPGKPIRISVQNGRVTLYGVVDSKADKEVAFMRANGVPGSSR